METSLSFTLFCVPTAQQRARHSKTAGGKTRSYKSDSQKANEEELEWLLLKHVPRQPIAGPVALRIKAWMPVPESAGKKKREEMLSGQIPHTKKPDASNLGKQLEDACTRLGFWRDDSQVTSLLVEKGYGEPARWEVEIGAGQ